VDDDGLAYDSPNRFERFAVITRVVVPGFAVSGEGGDGDAGVVVTRSAARAAKASRVSVQKVVFKVLADEFGSTIPEVHAASACGVVFDVMPKPCSVEQKGQWLHTGRDFFGSKPRVRELRKRLLIIPAARLPVRVPKFDVVLKEGPLQAVLAVHMIEEQTVLFTCNTCKERFPAFHPAYEPPAFLKLELLKRGADGLPLCNVEVAQWDTFPAFPAAGEESVMAAEHAGECMRCGVLAARDWKRMADGGSGLLVPKFSERNHMDPCWKFPYDELRELFASATLTEHCFVALEHMQVHIVTAQSTRLAKFRKNVISFAQDVPSFVDRVGLLCQYKVGDRVNTRLGPSVETGRLGKHRAGASDDERALLAFDEHGYLVFPATVAAVKVSGELVLLFDHGFGEAVRSIVEVTPRARMPWHPKFMQGIYKIFLRRNLGRGRVLEGLEL
jgi:hypothetical protein